MQRISRCLLFPGQGSQRAGVLNAVLERWPHTREMLEQADTACQMSISRLMLGRDDELLRPTEIAQPAILTHSMIVWSVVQRELGIGSEKIPLQQYASCALGHSLGEFTALCATQSISFMDAVRLVRKRGELMRDAGINQSINPAMAALMPCSKQFAELVCQHVMNDQSLADSSINRKLVVQPANFNTANQTVISGDAVAVDRAIEIAKQGLNGTKVKRAVKLPVSAPFHCSLMQQAEDQFEQVIQSVKWKDPILPVISNVTAQPVQSVQQIKDALKHHITSPVMFHQSIQSLITNIQSSDRSSNSVISCDDFLEMGPAAVLGPMTQSIAKDDGAKVNTTSLSTVEQIQAFVEQQQMH